MQKVFTLPEDIEAMDGIAERAIVPTTIEVTEVVVQAFYKLSGHLTLNI